MTRAEREDRAFVGWSLFERTVVEKSDLPAALKEAFVARYVNGRALASKWKTTLHLRVKVERDDRFDARNRLDRFAALTAYPHTAALVGEPARWLRRVEGQMVKAGGRYRRTSKAAKKVWHQLLAYNAHDCRALHHIVHRATFELEKWREYEATNYCVFEKPDARLCFRVGAVNRRLDALLERAGADRWAFLTAWNPASVTLPREENERRQAELLDRLAKYRVIAGEGVGQDVTWPPEPSLFVMDIPRKDAVRFGREFGQLAIVAGHKGYPARLIACSLLPDIKKTAQPPRRRTRVPSPLADRKTYHLELSKRRWHRRRRGRESERQS